MSHTIDWPTFSTSLTLGSNVTGSATATVFGNLVCIQMISIAGISSADTIICSIPDSLRPTAQFSAIRAVGLQTGGSWQEFNLVLVSQLGNSRIVAQGAPGSMNAGNYIFWYPLA